MLCAYGPCDEPLWHRLEKWLSKKADRTLLLLESDTAASRPQHPQVRRVSPSDEESLRQLAWELVFLRFGYVAAPNADFTLIEHYRQGVALLASDTKDLGVRVVSNAVYNLQMLPHSLFGPALKGSCAGLTAVICGAGPSLDAQVPHLRALEDNALLIAGGSALAALKTHGIKPHLAAFLEPDPPPQRFLPQHTDAMALFYQSRLSSAFVRQVAIPLVWMPSTGNYPIESHLASQCGFASEPFDAGWTVANFAIAIALYLGCSRIILCGIDCCCGPKAIYAASMPGDEHAGQLIELEKGKLYSRTDWLMSAEWIRSHVAARPDIEWINTSKPAEALLQMQAIPLDSLALPFSDIRVKVRSALAQGTSVRASPEQVAEVVQRFKQSVVSALASCESLLRVWEKMHPQSPLESLEYRSLASDFEQEEISLYFLMPLWEIWRHSILRGVTHPMGQELHRILFLKQSLELMSSAF